MMGASKTATTRVKGVQELHAPRWGLMFACWESGPVRFYTSLLGGVRP